MPFEIRHFVETNFYLRKDRSTHSISIISMIQMHVAGGGVGGLESIKLLTSFIQQMHEMKQGRIQDFSYVSQNFRSELDI